jgi:hypothetical protein
MQVTRAAFKAVASLNEQATDPKSHILVSNSYTGIFLVPLPAIPMVDPNHNLIPHLIVNRMSVKPGLPHAASFLLFAHDN